MGIINAGRILQLLTMVLIRIKAMDMQRNLCTNLRLIEVSGSHPDKEHQDHPLDLDQGLLNCHLDVEDEVALEVCWQCATCVMYISFNLPEYLFIKTCRLLKSLCITMDECIIFKLIYWRGAF